MAGRYKAVLYKSKRLADGKHPVMIRISIYGGVKYISTGIRCAADQWDDHAGAPLGASARERNLINLRIYEAGQALVDMLSGEVQTVERWAELIQGDKKQEPLVLDYYDQIIKDLEAAGSRGNAKLYRSVKSILKGMPGMSKKRIRDLDYRFILAWEQDLRSRGRRSNTVSVYMRNLRAVWNRAIKEGLVDQSSYPFARYKIPKAEKNKRALALDEIQRIRDLQLSGSAAKARDLYMLSFYLQGINLMDLLMSGKGSRIRGRLEYRRSKTGKYYSVRIYPEADQILQRYKGQAYLLDLLDGYPDPLKQVYNYTKTVNKYLRHIGEELALSRKLTYYTARHSYATAARDLGYPRDLIAAALGHSARDITDTYLADYDLQDLDQMLRAVLDAL